MVRGGLACGVVIAMEGGHDQDPIHDAGAHKRRRMTRFYSATRDAHTAERRGRGKGAGGSRPCERPVAGGLRCVARHLRRYPAESVPFLIVAQHERKHQHGDVPCVCTLLRCHGCDGSYCVYVYVHGRCARMLTGQVWAPVTVRPSRVSVSRPWVCSALIS